MLWFYGNKTIEVHGLIVLYKIAGNSYKGKEDMPKGKEIPGSFCLGLYRRYITLSLQSGALSLMILTHCYHLW